MHFKTLAAVFAALLATACAAPLEERQTCTFGQYSCATTYNGIVYPHYSPLFFKVFLT
jgi:hypothetical protein